MTRKTSKSKKGFPLYITGEPMNLTIYRERCRGEVRFALAYYDSTGGRQRRTFGTVDEANDEATKLKEEIRQGGWDLITLRGSERLAYQRAKETLGPLGVPLDLAVLKLVEALRVLGSDQLIEAARFYRAQLSVATLPRKTVPEESWTSCWPTGKPTASRLSTSRTSISDWGVSLAPSKDRSRRSPPRTSTGFSSASR